MSAVVFLIAIPLWLLRAAALVILAIPGVPLIAVLAWRGVYRKRPSAYFDRDVMQFPRWAWLFSNDEDGVDGLRGGDPAQHWWSERTAGWSDARRIFVWSAFRNPVNNLRYIPLLNPKFEPARIRFVGLDHEMRDGEGGWFFVWQGLYSGVRFETKTWRFWIGYKFRPEDRFGVDPADTRLPLCDFACQLKRV